MHAKHVVSPYFADVADDVASYRLVDLEASHLGEDGGDEHDAYQPLRQPMDQLQVVNSPMGLQQIKILLHDYLAMVNWPFGDDGDGDVVANISFHLHQPPILATHWRDIHRRYSFRRHFRPNLPPLPHY